MLIPSQWLRRTSVIVAVFLLPTLFYYGCKSSEILNDAEVSESEKQTAASKQEGLQRKFQRPIHITSLGAGSNFCPKLARDFLLTPGADAPPAEDGVARPGRSVLPMIAADASDWRTWQCCEYGNARMIRTERYKLIRRSVGLDGPFPDDLYDLVDDPRETTNRIGDPTYQNVTHELDGRLQAYFQRYAIDCCDGRRVQEMPWHNPVEPWRDARGDPDAERYLV